jgi:hypothetical protein
MVILWVDVRAISEKQIVAPIFGGRGQRSFSPTSYPGQDRWDLGRYPYLQYLVYNNLAIVLLTVWLTVKRLQIL